MPTLNWVFKPNIDQTPLANFVIQQSAEDSLVGIRNTALRDCLPMLTTDATFTGYEEGGRDKVFTQINAVYNALEDLQSQSGRKVVIAMTDGKDNQSRHSLRSTIKFAQENKVPVYTIGLGRDVLESQLRTMANETGGQYYFSPDAGQLASLYQDLAQTLQNEYSLTYTSPTPRRDGGATTDRWPGERAGSPEPRGRFPRTSGSSASGSGPNERRPTRLERRSARAG